MSKKNQRPQNQWKRTATGQIQSSRGGTICEGNSSTSFVSPYVIKILRWNTDHYSSQLRHRSWRDSSWSGEGGLGSFVLLFKTHKKCLQKKVCPQDWQTVSLAGRVLRPQGDRLWLPDFRTCLEPYTSSGAVVTVKECRHLFQIACRP